MVFSRVVRIQQGIFEGVPANHNVFLPLHLVEKRTREVNNNIFDGVTALRRFRLPSISLAMQQEHEVPQRDSLEKTPRAGLDG